MSCKEACWYEVKVNNNEKLLIEVMYRSPNSSDEHNQKLNDMLRSIVNEKHAMKIVMEDFIYPNINWDTWIAHASDSDRSHEFIVSVRDSFLCQCMSFNTRYRDKPRPSMLDLVFVNHEIFD